MDKHTQEEWLIEGNEIMTNNWRMIVKLPDDFLNLNEEDKANAKLIVSAPKLLEALKGLLSCNLPQNLIGGYQLYIENAEKIITEIEGRE